MPALFMPEFSIPKNCSRCAKPLRQGVRFCVACGYHNFDAEAAIADGACSKVKAIADAERQREKNARANWLFRVLRLFS